MPELHALDGGVGAVLSQDGSEAPSMYVLQSILSPAETNYDVGNKSNQSLFISHLLQLKLFQSTFQNPRA